MIPVRPWRLNFRAVFGALTDTQAFQWEGFLNESISPAPSEHELNEGMAALINKAGREAGKPGIMAFRNYVLRARGGAKETEEQDRRDLTDRARRIIRYATTPAQVWAACCNPKILDGEDRKALKDHAERTRRDLCDADGKLRDMEKHTITMGEIMKEARALYPAGLI